MPPSRRDNPERRLERTSAELRERIDTLDDEIEAAKKHLAARREDADEPAETIAGDWEETHDESGGEDPASAGRTKD